MLQTFTYQDTLFKEMMSSPKFPFFVTELNKKLNDEKMKRKKFYEKITPNDKAEFINGKIIMHSPVKFRHIIASDNLLFYIMKHIKNNKIGLVGHEKMMISLTRNDYEPDICFFKKEKAKKFKDTQMLFPAPDFIAEILSPSTEANDRGIKFMDYAAHGVTEYWIINPEEQTIEQYILKEEQYTLLEKKKTGIITSEAIEGFTLQVSNLFSLD